MVKKKSRKRKSERIYRAKIFFNISKMSSKGSDLERKYNVDEWFKIS